MSPCQVGNQEVEIQAIQVQHHQDQQPMSPCQVGNQELDLDHPFLIQMTGQVPELVLLLLLA